MVDRYGTAAKYRDYQEARGRVVDLDLADAEIEADLLVGSEYIDGLYEGVWMTRTYKTGGRSQARSWPRISFVDYYGYVIPDNEIPREIEFATYEAAWRQQLKPGSLSVDFTPAKYTQASIDGAVSVSFNVQSSASEVQTQIPDIARLLMPLLVSQDGGGNFSALSGRIERV